MKRRSVVFLEDDQCSNCWSVIGGRSPFCPLLQGVQIILRPTTPEMLPHLSDQLIALHRFVGTSLMLSSAGAVSGVPIRKWPGVREVKSWGSFDRGVIGREFKQASIIARSVYISSKFNIRSEDALANVTKPVNFNMCSIEKFYRYLCLTNLIYDVVVS
jgi:hypothetical protein